MNILMWETLSKFVDLNGTFQQVLNSTPRIIMLFYSLYANTDRLTHLYLLYNV